MKKMEADVVVIGAGASGIAAAVSAAEKDAGVIVVEKGSTTGGAANMGMGFFAAESKYQKAQMVDFSKDEAFNLLMEYTHWRVDARLVRKYIDQSPQTVEWLESIGVEFLGAYKYFEKSKQTWHVVKTPGSNKPAERAASNIYKALTERAGELGVEFCFQTAAKQIRMEDGQVVGITAVDAQGEVLEIDCGCVIVATGGFGDNPKMLKEHLGYEWGKDLFSFRIPGVAGEGLKMMWEAGGGKTEATLEMTYTTPGVTDVFKTLSETMRQPNLMVNRDGLRFINEEIMNNTTFTGNAIARQRERTAFTIISDSILEDYRRHGLDYITFHHNIKTVDQWDAELHTYLSGGTIEASGLSDLHQDEREKAVNLFMADSLDELAKKTGVNVKNLQATVDEYNSYCGFHDPFFTKNVKYLKALKGPKYYAMRHYPCGYGSLGGIKINDQLQVLNEEGLMIPGLYACGTDACGIFGDSYCFILPGNTMGFALNSGRMAGKNAIDYLDSDGFAG